MKGTIELDEMIVYAHHGCYEEERRVGCRFAVSISIVTDCTLAARTDSIADALNYVEVAEVVRSQMAVSSHLLENVVMRIINALRQTFPQIGELTVRVSKLAPPVGGQMKSVSLTMKG